MSDLSVIFITVLVCLELDFLSVLFCHEISDWLNAKSDKLRADAERIRNKAETLRNKEPEHSAVTTITETTGTQEQQ